MTQKQRAAATGAAPPPGGGLPARRSRRRASPSPTYETRMKAIFEAAALIFRSKGYEATTPADIAEAVGLNRASLYYYFSTKEELLIELISEPLLDNTARLARIVASDDPMASKVEKAIVDLMGAYDIHYPALSIYFQERLDQLLHDAEDPRFARLHEAEREYLDLWTKLLADARAQGQLRFEGSPRLVSLAVLGMIIGASRWYDAEGPLSAAEIGKLLAHLLFNGFQPATTS